MLSSELRAAADELIHRYPLPRSALLPLLHLVQAQDGHVGDDGIAECADLLALTRAEVRAVGTFYSMFKRAPMGRHLVSVCTNVSCMVRGGQEVYDRLSAKLGVGHNETTADGLLTLERAECLGNCEGAPVVTVDYLNYEGVSVNQAVELVGRLAAGELPPPTRGMPPPGVREVEYHLAGLGPRDPAQPGVATDQARASDAAPPAPTAGPGFRPLPVQVLSAEEAAERQRARAALTGAGHDPDVVEHAAGGRAREFPTIEPGDAPPIPPPDASEGQRGPVEETDGG